MGLFNSFPLTRRRIFRQRTATLRAIRRLRLQGSPYFVYDAVVDLNNNEFGLDRSRLGNIVPDLDPNIICNRIKQKLLEPRYEIFCKIFLALGTGRPVSIGIPVDALRHLKDKGIPININRSNWLLWLRSLSGLLGATLFFVHLLLQYKLTPVHGKPYLAFGALTADNFPSIHSQNSTNFISWFQTSGLRNLNGFDMVIEVLGSSPECSSPIVNKWSTLFPKQPDLHSLLIFSLQGISAIIKSIYFSLMGQWWRGIILREEIEAKYMSILPKNWIAKEYFFNQSKLDDKRLWLEIVEFRGAKVTCYWYSANVQHIQTRQNRSKQTPLLGNTLNWKNMIVWDTTHENSVRNYCPKSSYEHCGYMDYSDSGSSFKTPNSKIKIAVFDVSPGRLLMLPIMGYAESYHNDDLSKQFLSDLVWLRSNIPSVTILYKKKRRENANRVSLASRNHFNKFCATKYGIYLIDYGIGASRLIESCDGVIAMPFTSPAIIGKIAQKPTVYYDPTGQVTMNNQSGIPMVQSRDQLKKWLEHAFGLAS